MLNAWLMVLGLSFAVMAGIQCLVAVRSTADADGPPGPAIPVATVVALVLVSVPTMLQLSHYPSMLAALMRAAPLVEAGQWWRLGTSLVVQDGGIPGAVFNLVGLACIGVVAELMWGWKRWLTIAVTGVLIAQAVALFWQPFGAGNSIVDFSLAGAVCVYCLARCRTRPAVVLAIGSLVACSALLLLRDIHGVATLGGVIVAFFFLLRPHRTSAST